jgi:sigma-B regulation protein RsbU (phosphoserine phosphatase)
VKVLLVDDDPAARTALGELLEHAGHEVVTATGGQAAWAALQDEYFPLMLLDRVMPDLDGIELCRRIRARRQTRYTYVILVTMVGGKEPYLEGMNAGADDYFSKPFDPDELRARLRVAERVLTLQEELAHLRGLLSICAYCKAIRDEDDAWIPIERYIQERTPTSFSHGICPHCYRSEVRPEIARHRAPRGTTG